MDLVVTVDAKAPTRGRLTCNGAAFECVLGTSGVSIDKREGDGKTPSGRFLLRRVFYRADRVDLPRTSLPASPLQESDGWCDAPEDPAYNFQVKHPCPARAERLWRDDNRYNIIVVLGHNDDPVVPGAGSAIFLHIAADDLRPTEGCVALRQADLLTVLAHCTPETNIYIEPPTA